jgi:histidyl-tRNA synthetase
LGGPSIPAIGFALGLERLLLALPPELPAHAPFCFIAPLGERAGLEALVLGRELRALGVPVELGNSGGSLRSMLRRADAIGAPLCLVMGDSELERGVVQLKDLGAHQQEDLARSDVPTAIVERLRGLGKVESEGSP